ncbi:hypothetical protein LOCC1_G005405 [Lachnellula occidentalis]|uniref:Uncharacterized protein n=1 Tax=Lachnellula occidentalis TaxID=215460 RepID=A0A8H8UFH5_9HELO|nr:hypothetical protein LOCC1_G005405 [Lachnellula occidentalis]
MSPFARSIARTRLQAPQLRLFRQLGSDTMVSTKTSGRSKPDWGYQAKRAGGTALMYGPVVAVVMFWPYTVKPVMDRIRW